MGEWTLFSNHGHVLVCLAMNNQARLRDVAAEVGITERAVQNILRELQSSGLVQVSKHGRCNHYQINTRKPLRHPLEAHCTVGKLLQMLQAGTADPAASPDPAPVKAVRKSTTSGKNETAADVAKTAPLKTPSAKTDAAANADSKARSESSAGDREQSHTKKPETKKPDKPDKPEKPDTQQGSLF